MKKIAFLFLIYDIINFEDIWNIFFLNVDTNKYNIYIHYKHDKLLINEKRKMVIKNKKALSPIITTVLLSDTTGKLTLNLNSPLSTAAKTSLTTSTYGKFLLLSRRPDETNVILNFIKRDGKTSYGFLIPETISSAVLANIDTITKEVKQKLLNDQPIINVVNGGTFGP